MTSPQMHCFDLVWCICVFSDLSAVTTAARVAIEREAKALIMLRAIAEVAHAKGSNEVLHVGNNRQIPVADFHKMRRTPFSARMGLSSVGSTEGSRPGLQWAGPVVRITNGTCCDSVLARFLDSRLDVPGQVGPLRSDIREVMQHAGIPTDFCEDVEARFRTELGVEESEGQALGLLMLGYMATDMFTDIFSRGPRAMAIKKTLACKDSASWTSLWARMDPKVHRVPLLAALPRPEQRALMAGLEQYWNHNMDLQGELRLVRSIVDALRDRTGHSLGGPWTRRGRNFGGACRMRDLWPAAQGMLRMRREGEQVGVDGIQGRLHLLREMVAAWPAMPQVPLLYRQTADGRDGRRRLLDLTYGPLWGVYTSIMAPRHDARRVPAA